MNDILRELYNGEAYPAEQIEIEDESFQAVLQRCTKIKTRISQWLERDTATAIYRSREFGK